MLTFWHFVQIEPDFADIFQEKRTRTQAVTAAKHASTASTEVVDIFDDPLNASK